MKESYGREVGEHDMGRDEDMQMLDELFGPEFEARSMAIVFRYTQAGLHCPLIVPVGVPG